MSANAKKEITQIRRKLAGMGIEIDQLPNGHYRTKTKPPITFSESPSDTNAAHQLRRDLRKYLGIDLRSPQKKKGSAGDFAMQQLHKRTLAQMERGASVADLARLAIVESEAKRIGGWTSFAAAEVGISSLLRKGSRLMKANHDALAAALKTLESSNDAVFVKHLDKAAEHFGKTRHKAKPPEPKTQPKPPEGHEIVKPMTEEEHKQARQSIRDAARSANDRRLQAAEAEITELKNERAQLVEDAETNGHGKVEVTVKIELGDRTLALIEKLVKR
jgi:hypothetical protein